MVVVITVMIKIIRITQIWPMLTVMEKELMGHNLYLKELQVDLEVETMSYTLLF